MVVAASLDNINIRFTYSISIILIAYLCKRIGILTENDGKSLSKIILNITLPALILITISNIRMDSALIIIPFFPLLYSSAILTAGFIIFRNADRKRKGILLMCSLGFNIGLFAYPIIYGIFGTDGLKYIAMFDIGNAFVIFGLIYIIGAAYSEKTQKNFKKSGNSGGIFSYEEKNVRGKSDAEKEEIISDGDKRINGRGIFKISPVKMAGNALKNLPLLSYIAALFINGFTDGISGIIYEFLKIIANANEAAVLIVLGLFLNFIFDKNAFKDISKVIILRYSAGLAVGLILAFFILPEGLFREIISIAFILPVGMAVVPFAVEFGLDAELAGFITNITIVLSFGLMWILLLLV